MALTKGSVNPFNVLGTRRLSYIPKHFFRMTLSNSNHTANIDAWVYQNLDSRYAIIKSLKVDADNKMIEICELGVEDAKELTLLSLTCPFLDR